VPKPDLTVILDVDPQIAVERISRRGGGDKFEHAAFLRRVREIYLRRAAEEGYPVVDASRPPEAVAREVAEIIKTRLQIG
jgi:dTMP kinase